MIRVSVFEDNKHLRESLELLLKQTNGFSCSGAYENCNHIVDDLKENPCDIVLMDIEMPGMNGIEATRLIKATYPELQVLIQTAFFDDEYIFDAICNGASGYLLKSTSLQKYIEALTEVHSGGSPITPGIARRMLDLFQKNVPPLGREKYGLTDKEKIVLQHLVSGKSYKMIAAAMDISFETAKTHIKNFYVKLHVHSAPEAVAKAILERIV